MSRFNKLYHGDLEAVSEVIEYGSDLTPAETRAALSNLVRHLIRRHSDAYELEKRLELIGCRLDRLEGASEAATALAVQRHEARDAAIYELERRLTRLATAHELEGRVTRLEAGRCPETADAAAGDLEVRLSRLEAMHDRMNPDNPL